MNLPIKFEEKMKDLLQEEYEEYIKCYDEPRLYGLRVNTRKISVEEFLKISPFELKPIPWIENGFYYDGDHVQPSKHPLLFCRTLLSSGAKCDDSGKSSSNQSGR